MPYFHLPKLIFIEVSGRDSARYLHSRLSNDVQNIPHLGHRFAAALSPQGKAAALFCIFRLDSEKFLVMCDGGAPEEIEEALLKYKVSESLESHLITNMNFMHVIPEERSSLEEVLGFRLHKDNLSELSDYSGYAFPRTRSRQPGWDIALPKQRASQLNSKLQSAFGPEWNENDQIEARVLGNCPIFPEDVGSERVFSEYGLRQAISFQKGCYVGQEVMERVDSRGKAPRRLIRIALNNELSFPVNTKIEIKAEDGSWDAILLNRTKGYRDKHYAFLLISARAPELSEVEIDGNQATILESENLA